MNIHPTIIVHAIAIVKGGMAVTPALAISTPVRKGKKADPALPNYNMDIRKCLNNDIFYHLQH